MSKLLKYHNWFNLKAQAKELSNSASQLKENADKASSQASELILQADNPPHLSFTDKSEALEAIRAIVQIKEIIGEFGRTIDSVEDSDQKAAAADLYHSLHKCLQQYTKDYEEKGHKEAAKLFLYSSRSEINKAKPNLDGWGIYLENLCKKFANAFVYVITFGNSNGFFSYSQSKLHKAALSVDSEFEKSKSLKDSVNEETLNSEDLVEDESVGSYYATI